MAQINRSSAPSLLRPGLKTVFADWMIYPEQWKSIYRYYTSDKAVEYDLEMQTLGLAQLKQDGAAVASGSFNQIYQTAYLHQYYGLSFEITRAAILDNLYDDQWSKDAEQLKNSLRTLKNINAAFLFNNAFNAASTVSDQQPMCSTAHPISTGTLANTFNVGVGLTEAALEEAITIIKSWLNAGGLNLDLSVTKLLVPQANAFNASRILNSDYQPDTANNPINPIKHDRYVPGGYVVNNFIQDPNAWFLLTDEPNGFKYFQREPLDIDFITDVVTDNVTVRAIERYSFGNSNWRSVFGSTTTL